MNQGRIIVITGSPGTGKTTTASIVAKESDMDKSVHMHTDDFFHYLSKGAIPPHLPESNKQNLVVIEAFLEAVIYLLILFHIPSQTLALKEKPRDYPTLAYLPQAQADRDNLFRSIYQ